MFEEVFKVLLLGHVIDKHRVVSFEMIHPVIDLGLLADHQIHWVAVAGHLFRSTKGFAQTHVPI